MILTSLKTTQKGGDAIGIAKESLDKPMTFRRAKIAYLEEGRYGGLANSSIEAYSSDIDKFYSFIKRNFPNLRYIEKIAPLHLIRYDEWLLEQEEKEGVINKRNLKTLKMFFSFLFDYGYTDDNPYERVNFLKRKNEPKGSQKGYLSVEQVKEIISAVPKDDYRLTNKAILVALAYTGARISEVLQLDWDDISFGANRIKIKRKKNKTWSFIEMSIDLRAALKEHYEEERRLNQTDGPVFKNKEGKRLTYASFYYQFSKITSNVIAESEDKITPHRIRHIFCSEMNESGKSQSEIMHFTGHKRKQSLKTYMHVSNDRLADIVEIITKKNI